MNRERAEQAGAAGAAVAGTGAAVGAAAATACCVGPVISPLIVAVLGAGGAAAVAGLKPYTPYLLAGSAVLLAFGFRLAYRRPRECATDGSRPASRRWVRLVLWGAATVWLASLAVGIFVPR